MKLYTRNLVKKYHNRTVVDHVSFEVEQGEIVGLLGPNGAGKTTSFYMIVGLIRPREGMIFLDDEEITNLPVYMRARKGIGYLAQEPSVFRNLSVEDNLRAVLELSGLSKKVYSFREEKEDVPK
jgi:lipopolysaccharide export system ATP-binding protein